MLYLALGLVSASHVLVAILFDKERKINDSLRRLTQRQRKLIESLDSQIRLSNKVLRK